MANVDAKAAPSLPYHEPGIVAILILTSLLLLLNFVNSVLNRICYVGLLGQVLLGIAWGTPGANWLGPELETAVTLCKAIKTLTDIQSGGLNTSVKSLVANLWLSSMVAFTGIALPIGLSYLLMVFTNATALQAFAAGAALCSTSLGTTFTVMQTSGLNKTRMGVVLASAAMMDDVVGLVMVQVISNLGTTSASLSAATVIRPILVSLGFGLVVPIACRFMIPPLTKRVKRRRATSPNSAFSKLLAREDFVLTTHLAILISMITGASYAGTSNLFAAYLAGAAISWWDSDAPHNRCRPNDLPMTAVKEAPSDLTNRSPNTAALPEASTGQTPSTPIPSSCTTPNLQPSPSSRAPSPSPISSNSGTHIFSTYIQPTHSRLLQPFFFASIGFSIPITLMFTGPTLWRGLIYTLLMALAKSACGLWLLPYPTRASEWLPALQWTNITQAKATAKAQTRTQNQTQANSTLKPKINFLAPLHDSTDDRFRAPPAPTSSIYAPLILGTAMISRGEIGFLISSVANAKGLFDDNDSNASLFLIITWAIVLCTLIGPLGVGSMLKRLRRKTKGEGE